MNKNIFALAYLGDSVYEIYVRSHLLACGIQKVNDLQKEAVHYVSASAQDRFLKKMIDAQFLCKEELEIVYRARNHKVNHKPKNASIIAYKNATGLEALIGVLFLEKKTKRLDEIMNYIIRGE